MLSNIAVIAAQTRADADRFIALGAEPARVQVTGNLKFDARLPKGIDAQAHSLRRSLGGERPILIAASTHEGEEAILLAAFEQLLQRQPTALLLIAPRHPERFDRVFELCERRGMRVIRRSERRDRAPETQIFLIDSMGELPLFYAVSDVAFVGGSLVGAGGHNPLEPASLGVPVLTGPHVFNFQAIFDLLRKAQAAVMVSTAEQIAAEAAGFIIDKDRRRAAGARGLQIVGDHRGAVDQIMRLLRGYLP
jgi:3-deoxy-D-manno-octulosonic-acid transferase